MNILLDTNIIIPLEDTSKILDSSFAELRKLSAEQHHCLYIHPMQFEDIKRDKNQERRKIVLSRLKQYSQIENPPILSDQEYNELGLSQSNDNDKVDNNVLFALYRGAVHLLVTNDEGIHRKASKIGLQDKVYRLEQFLLLLQRYTSASFSFGYTGVKERFLYEIDKNQQFFESLRQSYTGFDEWFQTCATNKRKCWCIEDGTGNIVAICIYKHEQDARLTDNGDITPGRILKLCTFITKHITNAAAASLPFSTIQVIFFTKSIEDLMNNSTYLDVILWHEVGHIYYQHKSIEYEEAFRIYSKRVETFDIDKFGMTNMFDKLKEYTERNTEKEIQADSVAAQVMGPENTYKALLTLRDRVGIPPTSGNDLNTRIAYFYLMNRDGNTPKIKEADVFCLTDEFLNLKV